VVTRAQIYKPWAAASAAAPAAAPAAALAVSLLCAAAGCTRTRTGGAAAPLQKKGRRADRPSRSPGSVTRTDERADRKKDDVESARSIPELWTVMNRHHDELGGLLASLPESPAGERRDVERPAPVREESSEESYSPGQPAEPDVGPSERPSRRARRRPAPRARRGDAKSCAAPSSTQPTPRFRSRTRYRGSSLCSKVCRHTAAICRAAEKICVIARRLDEPSGYSACSRGRVRCEQAHRSAEKRCAPCPGRRSR
jgi:hypothetical protein